MVGYLKPPEHDLPTTILFAPSISVAKKCDQAIGKYSATNVSIFTSQINGLVTYIKTTV